MKDITFVSSQTSSTDSGGVPGHAMIAYEGVQDGYRFLKYVHATKRPRIASFAGDQSFTQVLIETSFRNDTLNGPTWPRPKEVVERMLRPILQAHQHQARIPFFLGRQVPAVVAPIIGRGGVLFSFFSLYTGVRRVSNFFVPYFPRMNFRLICEHTLRDRRVSVSFGSLVAIGVSSYILSRLGKRYDCLRWAIEQFPNAGVTIPDLPFWIITPNQFVEYVRSHQNCALLE